MTSPSAASPAAGRFLRLIRRRVKRLMQLAARSADEVAETEAWKERIRTAGLRSLVGQPDESGLMEVIRRFGSSPDGEMSERWFSILEARRSELLNSATPILVSSSGASDELTTVAEVCARTSKKPPWASFLFDLVRTERPKVVVEMGTSVGISGSYLAAALATNGRGRLVTLEGRADVAAEARRGFAELSLPVEVIVGRFNDTLIPALEANAPVELMFIDGNHHEEPTIKYFTDALPFLAPRGLVVFDDIRWSAGMERAWEYIAAHPAIGAAIDLREIGFVRLAS